MNRAWFGAWGAGLELDRFAAALAAVGVAQGRPGVHGLKAIETAWASPLMQWRLPASLDGYDPEQLADAWHFWRRQWRQRNPSRGGADPRARGPRMPRLAVEWSDRDDPSWVVSQLSRAAIGPLTVHISDLEAGGSTRWNWPLEIGLLDDPDAEFLRDQIVGGGRPWSREFMRLSARAGVGGACDVLLVTGPLRASASTVFASGIRASCVLCLRAPTDRWSVTGPLLRAVQAHVRAAGIGYSPVSSAAWPSWLGSLLVELAHAHPLDVSLGLAAQRVGGTAPVLFATESLLEETRLSRVEQRVRARLERGVLGTSGPLRDAGHALPKSELTFDHELAGAQTLRLMGQGAEPPPPPAARFIQARILSAGGEALSCPLTPGAPHVVQVRIAEPERGWTSARREAFPAPEGDVAHRLTVVLTAPDVVTEPLLGEIVLPTRGPSSACEFHLVPGLEDTRLRARIVVLHGNRVLQTAIFEAPVGGTAAGPLTLAVEPEAAPRLGLDDLDWRRPFDAALLVNHDEAGKPGVTAISGGRAQLLLPPDFQKVTELLQSLLEEAVLEPDGFDTLEDPSSVELLMALANHGHALYETFMASDGAQSIVEADRIQLVVLRYGGDFPLEFVYERVAPDRDAALCARAFESLREGRCGGCSPPNDPSVVCPMAFWGLTKSIERLPYEGPTAAYHPEVRAEASRDCSQLAAPTGALFAASENVREEDVEKLRETLASAIAGPPQEATSWKEWRESVAAEHPPLLVLLPHTEPDPVIKVPALEIGGNEPLPQTNVRADVICPQRAHRPLVILLGCSTAATGITLYDFPPKFQAAGAAIVLGTVTKVLGRHAARAAGMIVAELVTRAASGDAYITDVIRDLRRSLLAEGLPLGMAVVAYGDGDWMLGGA